MYAYVSPAGTVSFRYDYRINGRRETLVIGKYGRDGISLCAARERCLDARRMVREGISPAKERQREKQKLRQRGCKIYSLHAHEVECFGKGKAHAPYEFGVKVSVATMMKRSQGAVSSPCMPWHCRATPMTAIRWQQ